jgi:hypothetical protein
MPVALVEAMACGLVPVCLSEESGINEILKNNINGLIVNDRENSYWDAILTLKNDKALWERLSLNARETIKGEFSSKISCQHWISFLKSFESKKSHKKIRIPLYVNINSVGKITNADKRKPDFGIRFSTYKNVYWLKLRLAIRPRVRLRKLLNIQKVY